MDFPVAGFLPHSYFNLEEGEGSVSLSETLSRLDAFLPTLFENLLLCSVRLALVACCWCCFES